MARGRGVAWLCLFTLAAGCVFSVPDYHVTPGLLVLVSPYGPQVCTERRKPYRTITVTVHLRGLPDAPVRIETNSTVIQMPSSRGAVYAFRAGVGKHLIEVESGGFRAERPMSVHRCGEGLE